MSIKFFRPLTVITFIIKGILLFYVEKTDFKQKIEETPFFMTKFSSYDRINEAHFFIERDFDPYIANNIFQVNIYKKY